MLQANVTAILPTTVQETGLPSDFSLFYDFLKNYEVAIYQMTK